MTQDALEKRDAFAAKIQLARVAIAKAEADLEQAMGQIQVAPRSQKINISEALENAFAKLRVAKKELADVEALMIGKEAT